MSEKWCDPGLRAAWRSSGGGLITRGFAIVRFVSDLVTVYTLEHVGPVISLGKGLALS